MTDETFKIGDRVFYSDDLTLEPGTVIETVANATYAGRVKVEWDDGEPSDYFYPSQLTHQYPAKLAYAV